MKLKNGKSETLQQRYDNIIRQVSQSNDESYKLELLGPQLLEGAPLDYWIGEVCRNIGVDEILWQEQYSIEYQGKVIAGYQLSNQIEFVNRHEINMRQKLKEMGASGKENNFFQNAAKPNPARASQRPKVEFWWKGNDYRDKKGNRFFL